MQFVKKVVYLGDRTVTLKDGMLMHGLSFFDADSQDTVEVNVMASNSAVCSVLPSVSFGSPCDATFALRPADKLYKLALVGLSASSGK